jgi:hypothetical protein
LRYLVLDPIIGELAIFQSEKYFLEHKTEKSDIVRLSVVLCAMHSFNTDLTRRSINSIELTFVGENLQLFMGCYD